MNRVLVDSSVWVDHLRGVDSRETRLLRSLLGRLGPSVEHIGGEPVDILVGDVALSEVLRGIDDDRQRARVRRTLLSFEIVSLGGEETALMAVEHYVALRRLGQTIRKAIDCLIAAWCIKHGVPLLQADRDFLPFAQHRDLLLA